MNIKKLSLLLGFALIIGGVYSQNNQSIMQEVVEKSESDKLFNQGVNLFKKGDSDAAFGKFDACLLKQPTYLSAVLAKGYIMLSKNQYEDALVFFNMYENRGGTSTAVYEYVADAEMGLDNLSEALAAMNKAVSANPQDVNLLQKRAAMLAKGGRYQDAVSDLNVAIEKESNNESLYKQRAEAKRAIEDYDGAIEDYNKLIEMDGKNARYYSARAIVKDAKMNYDEALEDINQAIDLDSKYTEAYLNRGVVYIHQEKYDEAEADCKYVLSKDNNNAIAYNNLGVVYFHTQKIEESIEQYNKAISLKSDYAYAYFNRGVSKIYVDKEAAKEDWNIAISYGCVEAARYLLGK